MRKPVEAFELHCDGCGERFEGEDFTCFINDWPFDEYGWIESGDIALCEDCKSDFTAMVEVLADGGEL